MTREGIEKSLKPIEWTYKHEFCSYVADLGVGDIRIRIEPHIGAPDNLYLTAERGRGMIFDRSNQYKTLEEAMSAARAILIDEVCSLFNLDEQ